MGLRGRLDRAERSAKPLLRDGRDPVADEVCRMLSDQELRLLVDVLNRGIDPESGEWREVTVSPAERAALDRFYGLYEEVRRGD